MIWKKKKGNEADNSGAELSVQTGGADSSNDTTVQPNTTEQQNKEVSEIECAAAEPESDQESEAPAAPVNDDNAPEGGENIDDHSAQEGEEKSEETADAEKTPVSDEPEAEDATGEPIDKKPEDDPNSFIYKVIKYNAENGGEEAKPAKRKKRTALTVTLIVLAFICVVGASAVLLFHDIYSKLDYDDAPSDAEMNAAIDRWKEAEASGLNTEDEEEYSVDGKPEEPVETVDPGMDFSTIDVSQYPDSDALLAYSQELQAEADDLYSQADAKQQEADDYATLAQMRLEYEEEQARLEEERIKSELMAAMEADGGDPITDDNVVNILLLGIDTRDPEGTYARSDTMILLSVNKETKEIVLSSFMRDSYVYIPGIDDYGRLNSANAIGGPTFVCKTISQVFGVRVDKYASVNFFSFIDIVDAMGGIDIEVTEEEIGQMNDNLVHQNWVRGYEDEMDFIEHGTAGMMHLNGNQALAYARIRYVGGDQGRTARQRQVISILIDKLRGMSVTELYALLDVVLPLVKTNLTEVDCFSVLLNAAEYDDYTIKSIRIPYDGAYKYARIDGMSVLEIDLDKCKRYLRNAIYG